MKVVVLFILLFSFNLVSYAQLSFDDLYKQGKYHKALELAKKENKEASGKLKEEVLEF